MEHLHDLEYNGESWDLRMSKKNQSWTVVKYCKLILFRVMVVLVVKKLTCLPVREIRSDQGDPLEEETTHSSILAWKIPGQRSLAVYSSRGCKESDMTEQAQESEFIAKEQSESQQIKNFLGEASGVKEVLAELT